MFDPDPYNYGLSPLQSPWIGADDQPDQNPQADDRDALLEAVTRFAALVCLGVLITLFARTFPALRPFYWIAVVGVLMALGIGSYLGRNVKLIALTVAVAIAIVAGHWDYLNDQGQRAVHTGQQVIQNGQQAIQERLP